MNTNYRIYEQERSHNVNEMLSHTDAVWLSHACLQIKSRDISLVWYGNSYS